MDIKLSSMTRFTTVQPRNYKKRENNVQWEIEEGLFTSNSFLCIQKETLNRTNKKGRRTDRQTDRKVRAGRDTSVLDLQSITALIPSVTRPPEPLRDKTTTEVLLEEQLLEAMEEVEWSVNNPPWSVTQNTEH